MLTPIRRAPLAGAFSARRLLNVSAVPNVATVCAIDLGLRAHAPTAIESSAWISPSPPAARTTSYGDRGQATSFTPSGQSAIAQTYSGSGNQNRVTSGTTTFMPSPLSPAPAWTATGSTTTWTVRDPDGHLLAIRVGPTTSPATGTVYAPFTDNQGNVRAMTQPYRYGSGYTDDPTGLIKLGVRYYDPTHGRYTQQDPTGKDKYAYSYASNSPVNYVDSLGTSTATDIINIGGGVLLSVGVFIGLVTLAPEASVLVVLAGAFGLQGSLGLTALAIGCTFTSIC